MEKADILFKINELNVNIFKAIAKRYKNMGLSITPVQARIIMAIYDEKVISCQKDIEKIISCNKSTLSAILNTMEKNSLIKRVEYQSDFRRNKIILTDHALKIAKILKEDKEKISSVLVNNITLEEYTYFNEIMEKMKKNIERI